MKVFHGTTNLHWDPLHEMPMFWTTDIKQAHFYGKVRAIRDGFNEYLVCTAHIPKNLLGKDTFDEFQEPNQFRLIQHLTTDTIRVNVAYFPLRFKDAKENISAQQMAATMYGDNAQEYTAILM